MTTRPTKIEAGGPQTIGVLPFCVLSGRSGEAAFQPVLFEGIGREARIRACLADRELWRPLLELLKDKSSIYHSVFLGWTIDEQGPRWTLIDRPDCHIDEFDKLERFQKHIHTGRFSNTNTSSLVARSIAYMGPEEISPTQDLFWSLAIAPKMQPGVDFHDFMEGQLRVFDEVNSIEPSHVIQTNKASLEVEIQNGAEYIRKLREYYDSSLKVASIDENLLPSGEISGIKVRKSRPIEEEPEDTEEEIDPNKTLESDPIDEDLVEDDIEEIDPEEDEVEVGDEEAEIFSDSGSETSESTCYNNDPRFTDDEEESSGRPEGCDWIERSRDGRDATRQTNNPPTHEDLQALRNFVVARPDPVKHSVVLEMVLKGRTAEEVAVKHEVEPKTAQKWKERTMKAAELLKDRPSGMPDIPTTDEMFDIVLDGGAYVLVNLGDGWKYRPLDVENHDTLDQAIAALKESQICVAWKDSDVHKKTVKRYRSLLKGGRLIDLAQIQEYRCRERAKVADRINQCFEQIYTFPSPEKWVNRRVMLMKEKELAEANENEK